MIVILFIVGLITAFVGSVAGLGGGVILVPALLFLGDHLASFNWVNPQTVVGISLIVMVVTGMSSTISYLKHKRVDIRFAMIFLIGSVPGGITGSWLNTFFQTDEFSLLFGAIMIFVSLLFFLPRRATRETHELKGIVREKKVGGDTFVYSMSLPAGLSLSFVVGLLSGLLGIGGGSLMVPAMILLFSIPPHIATATSMFMIFISSIFSSVTHTALGHIEWEYVFYFLPGAYIGGTFGAKLNRHLKGQAVEWFLRVVLIFVGIRLIWQGLS